MSRLAVTDLLPGTTYAVQVRAVGGQGNVSEWSPRVTYTTIDDTILPATPDSLIFVAIGDSFHAEWSPVTQNTAGENVAIARYELEVTANSTTVTRSVPHAVTLGKIVFDLSFEENIAAFIAPQPSVSVRVRAVDTRGLTSSWTSVVSAQNPVPAPPTAPSNPVSVGVDSISLRWLGPADRDLAGYNVYVGTVSNFTPSSSNLVYKGDSTQYTHVTTTYTLQYFKIRSYDKFNQESSDLVLSGTPTNPFVSDTTPPSPATNVSVATGYDNTRKETYLDLSWTSSVSTDVAYYTVRYGPSDSGPWFYQNLDKEATTARLYALTAGAQYYLGLRATDTSGNLSGWASVTNSPIIAGADSTPPAQTVGLAVNASTTSFIATWTASTANDLKEYEVGVNYSGGTEVFYKTTATRFDFTLEQNRAAFATARPAIAMRVRAIDFAGNAGTWSSTVTATNAAPAAPTALANTVGANSINIRWTASTATDVAGYNVYMGTSANPTTRVAFIEGTAYTTTATAAQYFSVRALDVFGQESASLSGGPFTPTNPFLVDTTPPAVPTSLAATLTNNANGIGSRASLTWTNGGETDRAGIIVGYKRNADTTWSSVSFAKDDTSGIIDLPYAYTAYDFRIRAYDNSANYSAWSATLAKAAVANVAPAVPTALTSTSTTNAITYSWTGVADTDLANYEVTFSTNSSFTAGPNTSTYLNGTATSLTMAGLNPNTTYYARVRSVDNGGLSSAFTATDTRATKTYQSVLTDGVPPTSSPAAVVTGGIASLQITWSPVANNDLVTYEIHMSTTSGFTPSAGTKLGENLGTSFFTETTVAGTPLLYNTTYFVRIIAKDADGSAAAGTQGSGTILKVRGPDIDAELGGNNFLKNSSFEKVLTNWGNLSSIDSTGVQTTTTKYGNQAFVGTHGTSGVNSFINQVVPMVAGRTYIISGWRYLPEAPTGNAINNRSILVISSAGGSDFAATTNLTTASPVGVWFRDVLTFVPGASGNANVRFYVPKGTIYWDGLQVEEGDVLTAWKPNPQEISDNADNAQNTADGKNSTFTQSTTPTATKAGDIWIDTGNNGIIKIATAPGTGNWVIQQLGTGAINADIGAENLLLNGNFAANSPLPGVANGATSAIDTSMTFKGARTILVTHPTTSSQNGANLGNMFAGGVSILKPNTKYTFSAWLYMPSATGPTNGVQLNVQGPGLASNVSTTLNKIYDSWFNLRVTFTTGSSVNTINPYILSQGTTAGQNFYIGQVSISTGDYTGADKTTFTQNTAPTAIRLGDVWIDTGNGNIIKIWDGVSWSARQDAAIPAAALAAQNAQNTANSKNRTFVQGTVPTSLATGDVWVDISDNNKTYIANAAGVSTIVTSGNGWYLRQDGTKTGTFAQGTIPTSTAIGDLWVNISDSNKIYRAYAVGASTIAAGQWQLVQDISNLATTAYVDTQVNTSASGKNKITHSINPATTPYTGVIGDTWFQVDDFTNNRVIGQWRWDGAAWFSETLRNEVIANLDASKITANSTFTNSLNVKSTFTLGDAGVPGLIQTYNYTPGTTGFKLGSNGLEINEGFIAAKALYLSDLGNYAAGSDWEGTHRWTLYPTYANIVTDQAKSGTKSLMVSGNGTAGSMPPVAVNPGDQIYLEFWVMRTADWNGVAGNSKIRIANNANNALITDLNFSAANVGAAMTWNKLTRNFTVPAGVTSLAVSLVTAGTAGNVWIDDIIIYNNSNARLAVAGSITANALTTGTLEAGVITIGANGVIKSNNFATGNAGWQLSQNGLEINDGTIKISAVTNLQNTIDTTGTNAYNNAVTASIVASSLNQNPTFSNWTGTYPVGAGPWSTSPAPTKETTLVRTPPNAVRLTSTGTSNTGMDMQGSLTGMPYADYITVEVDVMLVDNGSPATFAGSGIVMDWSGTGSPNRDTVSFHTIVPNPVFGQWYKFTKVLRRQTMTGTFTQWNAWMMNNFVITGWGATTAKTMVFDRLSFRHSTVEEITAFNAPGNLSAGLATRAATFVTNVASPAAPSATSAGDIWYDQFNLRQYRSTAAGTGSWVLVNNAYDAIRTLWGATADTTQIDGGKIYTNTILAKSIQLADYNNYAMDPKFAIKTTWTNIGGAATYVNGTGPLGTTTTLLQHVSNGANIDNIQPYLPTVQGETYYAEIWVKVSGSNSTGNVVLSLTTADANNTLSYPAFVSTNLSSLTLDTWTKISGTYTMPAGIIRWTPRISTRSAVPAGSTIQWSDIVITRTGMGNLYVDGNITASKISAGNFTGGNFNVAAGGEIRSSLYTTSGGTQGFRLTDQGLELRSGVVNANTIVAGTGIVNNLVVNTGGAVQSSDYASGSTGWYLGNNSLIIRNGIVNVAALSSGSLNGEINIGGGGLVLNGGILRSNTYGSSAYNSAATAGFFISNTNIHIPDGNISAKAITTGTISGTNTITLSGANAKIVGGGFELSGSGLLIPNGAIQAAALNIQNGSNLLHPAFADFEFESSYYSNSAIIARTNTTTNIVTNDSISGSQSLEIIIASNASQPNVFFGFPNYLAGWSDASKTYIVSWYAKNTGATDIIVRPIFRNNPGTGNIDNIGTNVNIPAGSDWTRYSRNITTSAASIGKYALWFQFGANNAGTIRMDAIQVEEKVSNSDTPSTWSPPGSTTVVGNAIRTGSIVSNNTTVVNGSTVPLWSINTQGGATFATAQILGDTLIGNGTTDTTTILRSSNWAGTGNTTGWGIRGDGQAWFNDVTVRGNLQGNANSVITGGKYWTANNVGNAGGPAGVEITPVGLEAFSGGTTRTFFVDASNGNTTIAGTLNVTGTTTLGGTLNVSGSASMAIGGYIRGGGSTATSTSSPGTTGWIIDRNGAYFGPNSTITAGALQIQSGNNLMPAIYANLETTMPTAYSGSTLSWDTTNKYLGAQSLRVLWSGATGTTRGFVFTDTTNVSSLVAVEPNRTYFLSFWARNNTTTAVSGVFGYFNPGGSAVTTGITNNVVTIPSSTSGWTRIYATLVAPAGLTGIRPYFASTTTFDYTVDALQVEEKFGLTIPGPWVSPGVTTIDGAMISTGTIRSNQVGQKWNPTGGTGTGAYEDDPTRWAWELRTSGTDGIATFSRANVTGTLVVGSSSTDINSLAASSNFTPGQSGWQLRGDGKAEFRDVVTGSLDGSSIKTDTLDVKTLKSGDMNANINIKGGISVTNTSTGSIIGMSVAEGFFIRGPIPAGQPKGPTYVSFPLDGTAPNIISGVLQATTLSVAGNDDGVAASFYKNSTIQPTAKFTMLSAGVASGAGAPTVLATYQYTGIQDAGYGTRISPFVSDATGNVAAVYDPGGNNLNIAQFTASTGANNYNLSITKAMAGGNYTAGTTLVAIFNLVKLDDSWVILAHSRRDVGANTYASVGATRIDFSGNRLGVVDFTWGSIGSVGTYAGNRPTLARITGSADSSTLIYGLWNTSTNTYNYRTLSHSGWTNSTTPGGSYAPTFISTINGVDVRTASDISLTQVPAITGLWAGTGDLGALRVIPIHSGNTGGDHYVINPNIVSGGGTVTAAMVTAERWPVGGKGLDNISYNGTVFVASILGTIPETGNTNAILTYSTLKDVSPDRWAFATTKYDSAGPSESTFGDVTYMTMKKRAWWSVTPDFGGVSAARVYVGKIASGSIARTALWLQGSTVTTTQGVLTSNTLAVTGTNPPATSNYPVSGSGGSIISGATDTLEGSTQPSVQIRGDGYARFRNMSIFGTLTLNGTTMDDSGWVAPTFANPSTGFTNVAGQLAAGYRRRNGVVYLRGRIGRLSASNNQTIYTLPVGYRPSGDLVFVCYSGLGGNGFAVISVISDGRVFYNTVGSGGDPQQIDLANISFALG